MKKLIIIAVFIVAIFAIAGCFDFKNEQQQLPPQIQKWLELYGIEAE